jgi:MerR family transcriptional regulator, copper efflux regulator
MLLMTIGQVANASGVGIQTLRYYEREKLLSTAARKPSGYRLYRSEVVARLRFIRRAKDLGFSLDEIRELLRLQDEKSRSRAKVKAIADRKIAQLDDKIRDLSRMREVLAHLSKSCSGKGAVHGCPIVEALQAND